MKKSIDWANVLFSAASALLSMFLLWQSIDARVFVLFVVFLAVAEVFVRIRWRLSLPCPHCGFDPVLYKTNRDLAVQKVKQNLEELRLTGRHLLKQNNPFQNLPVVAPNKMTKKMEVQVHKQL